MILSSAFYADVYDMLVLKGQTANYQADKDSFVRYFSTGSEWQTKEWRFSGDLGFGGKFWRNPGNGRMHYVSCYSEDLNVERKAICDSLNSAIRELEVKHNVGL